MTESHAYHLRPPLPPRSEAIGPSDWSDRGGQTLPFAAVYADLDSGVEALTAAAAATGYQRDAGPSLLFIHADWLAARGELPQLAGFLARITAASTNRLPVLLYRELGVDEAVELARAGLFAALPVPVEEKTWQALLARAQLQAPEAVERQRIRLETDNAARRLQEHRRQIDRDAQHLTDELVDTQKRLEDSNRQLADSIAQLSLLYRFGRELSAARNWDRTLESILANLTTFIGASGAALILRSASGGAYAARQTYRWDETAWDKVVLKLQGQIDAEVAESMLAPGVFHIGAGRGSPRGEGKRIIALPLEHQSVRLGFCLLLMESAAGREAALERFLPFLQAVQLVLSEEVAAAQMLDRMRDIGSFNARVLETVSSGIWVVDETGRTVYCNRAGRRLLTGLPVESDPEIEIVFTLGRGRQQFGIHGEGARLAAERCADLPELLLDARLRLEGMKGVLVGQLFAQGESGFRSDGKIVQPGGESIPVLVQTSSMAGRQRDQRWLVLVVEDLRETKKLAAERSRADRLEGLVEMSATLAHEIRNPLMGLSAQAELLADQLSPTDQRKRYIDLITTEVERINETITRLLDYVRPYEPRFRETSVRELSEACVDLVTPAARKKDIAITLEVVSRGEKTAACRQELDSAQIKQVILNLLLNAVDAAPRGGEVTVRLRQTKAMELVDTDRGTSQLVPGCIVEVTDNGEGVPVAHRDKIFRPFFTTKNSGTGLGLSICRKIVNAHGGEITVRRVRERTRFRVQLPQSPPAGEALKGMETK